MGNPTAAIAEPQTLSSLVARASLEHDSWIAEGEFFPAALPSGVRAVNFDDPEYPSLLRDIEFPPRVLHVAGNLKLDGPLPIAIVGSRQPSAAGASAARELAAHLAGRGHPIVSGLAAGVDTAAHEGALAADGHTIAVVGTGIDQISPASNAGLRDCIASSGAVISQFPLGHTGSKTTFPARNALIAGLAAVSVLVELEERSGTRIEANISIEQNKPVLLWKPILGEARWAHEFALHPLVSFVSHANAIIHAVHALA